MPQQPWEGELTSPGGHLPVRAPIIWSFLACVAACSHNPRPSSPSSTLADTAAVQTGYGTPDARNRTGAAQSIDTADVKGDRVTNVEQLIQGRFAGVQVVRLPDGGFSLRIRGASSVLGNTQPLYVVDGVALPPAPEGALIGVDPRDIERIEVLKDASSTAIYGVRGANGVILIRTKRAH